MKPIFIFWIHIWYEFIISERYRSCLPSSWRGFIWSYKAVGSVAQGPLQARYSLENRGNFVNNIAYTILDKRFYVLCPSITLRPPSLDSEKVWTGDFWSKTVFLENNKWIRWHLFKIKKGGGEQYVYIFFVIKFRIKDMKKRTFWFPM